MNYLWYLKQSVQKLNVDKTIFRDRQYIILTIKNVKNTYFVDFISKYIQIV